MVDKYDPATRRKMMQSVKSKGTRIEEQLRKELWRHGIRYRKNIEKLFGKPDISIKKYKVVIFIDSCFWHGCSIHCRYPKTNKQFWENKIKRNIERDAEVTRHYNKIKWNILRLWEHQIKDDFKGTIKIIENFLNGVKNKDRLKV